MYSVAGCRLGSHASCILVCEVDPQEADRQLAHPGPNSNEQRSGGQTRGGLHAGGTPGGAQPLPSTYLVINRPEHVKLSYILVYTHLMEANWSKPVAWIIYAAIIAKVLHMLYCNSR